MSKDDIDKAVKDAEAFAEQDKKRREEIDVKNSADQMVYQTEKSMADLGDKLQGEEKSALEEKLTALKSAISGGNVDEIKQKTEELQKKFYEVSERVYKEAAAQQRAAGATPGADAGAAGAQSAPGDDGVVDADFTEVDDDKK